MSDWFTAWTDDPLRVRLAGATAAILLAAVVRLAQQLAVRRLTRFAAGTSTSADDLIVELLKRVSLVFIVTGSVAAVGAWLPLTEVVHRFLRGAFVIACAFQAGIWGNCVISYLLGRQGAAVAGGGTATTLAAIAFVARLALWSALVLGPELAYRFERFRV